MINNNNNFKTKAINTKLKINYYFVLYYNCTLRRDFNLNSKKKFKINFSIKYLKVKENS